MEELEQAELSAEETASAEGQGETEAEQEAAESEREEGSEESSEEKGKQKPPRGLLKKIGKLTRQKYELLERNNELSSKYDALEQRLAKLEGGGSRQEETKPNPKPKVEDFATYEEFSEALIDWKADQKIAAAVKANSERESKQADEEERREIIDAYNERVKEAQTKYDDYDEALEAASTKGARVDTFQAVQMAIYELDNGPDVAYYLAKHADERNGLLTSSPMRAVAQLGRIAAALAESEESEEEESEERHGDQEPAEDSERAPQPKMPRPVKHVKKSGKMGKPFDPLDPTTWADFNDYEKRMAERERRS